MVSVESDPDWDYENTDYSFTPLKEIHYMHIQLPERHGAFWEDNEVRELRRKLRKGMSVEKVAAMHRRTCVSIRMKARSEQIPISDDIVLNGKNYTELLEKTKLKLAIRILQL